MTARGLQHTVRRANEQQMSSSCRRRHAPIHPKRSRRSSKRRPPASLWTSRPSRRSRSRRLSPCRACVSARRRCADTQTVGVLGLAQLALEDLKSRLAGHGEASSKVAPPRTAIERLARRRGRACSPGQRSDPRIGSLHKRVLQLSEVGTRDVSRPRT